MTLVLNMHTNFFNAFVWLHYIFDGMPWNFISLFEESDFIERTGTIWNSYNIIHSWIRLKTWGREVSIFWSGTKSAEFNFGSTTVTNQNNRRNWLKFRNDASCDDLRSPDSKTGRTGSGNFDFRPITDRIGELKAELINLNSVQQTKSDYKKI